MSNLLRGSALAAVAFVAASATPASAIVYVVTLTGQASENYRDATDAAGTTVRQDFAAGGAFTATLRFDTARLPANAPGAGEDFRFEDGSTFFTADVTFAGGGLSAFGGTSTRNSLAGVYGPGGYFDLYDDRLLQDDADFYESAGLYLTGFDGLAPLAGAFPDFASAGSLSFTLTGFRLDNATGASTSGYAYGAIDSVSVVTAGAVPEPASWATMALGFGLLGAAARRRRTVAHA